MRTKAQKANYDKAVKRIRRFAKGTVNYAVFRAAFRETVTSLQAVSFEDYDILMAREELAFRYFQRNGGTFIP